MYCIRVCARLSFNRNLLDRKTLINEEHVRLSIYSAIIVK